MHFIWDIFIPTMCSHLAPINLPLIQIPKFNSGSTLYFERNHQLSTPEHKVGYLTTVDYTLCHITKSLKWRVDSNCKATYNFLRFVDIFVQSVELLICWTVQLSDVENVAMLYHNIIQLRGTVPVYILHLTWASTIYLHGKKLRK